MLPRPLRSLDLEAVGPGAAGVLLAAPILAAYYPPMSDLPLHEAAVGILRHYGDPSLVPPGLYTLNLGEPNQLFHLTAWALSYVVSTRWAVKLVVAATVALLPVCAARLARHAGASPLAGVAAAPVALGWLFDWGLVANLIGLAALLAVLPSLDDLAARPSPKRAAIAAAATGLLYLAHGAMMLLYAGAACLFALLRPWSRRSTWTVAPVATAAALTALEAERTRAFETAAGTALPTLWTPLWRKVAQLPDLVAPSSDAAASLVVVVLFAIVLAAFAALRQRERRGAAPGGLRAWALEQRWALLALAGLAAFFAFPLTLHGATLVYQRWLAPALAIGAVAVAPARLTGRPARVALLTLAALPLATLAIAWPSFVDSDRAYRALDELAAQIAPGSAVATLNLGHGDPSRTYSLGSADGRILATRGGRLAYAFTDTAISPVVIAPAARWQESLLRIGWDAWDLRPSHDLHRFRYLLLRSADVDLVRVAAMALEPQAEVVASAGEWALLESRLPLVSVTAPDAPLETPEPESLRSRAAAIAASLRSGPNPVDVAIPPAPPPNPIVVALRRAAGPTSPGTLQR